MRGLKKKDIVDPSELTSLTNAGGDERGETSVGADPGGDNDGVMDRGHPINPEGDKGGEGAQPSGGFGGGGGHHAFPLDVLEEHQGGARDRVGDLSHFNDSADRSLTVREIALHLANRVVLSRFYSLFYLFMIGVNLWVIYATLVAKGYPSDPYFIALETIVNVFLIAEVSLRFWATGRHFWHSCGNVFDFFVCILVVTTFAIYLFGTANGGGGGTAGAGQGSENAGGGGNGGSSGNSGKSGDAGGGSGEKTANEVQDVVATTLTVLRCGVQYLRLLLLVRNRARDRGDAIGDGSSGSQYRANPNSSFSLHNGSRGFAGNRGVVLGADRDGGGEVAVFSEAWRTGGGVRILESGAQFTYGEEGEHADRDEQDPFDFGLPPGIN